MKGLKDAKRALTFEILKEDVEAAKQCDKNYCVIANALCANPGIQKVEVGARYARVWSGSKITRYQTPKLLREALTKFDDTGHWSLPEGLYSMKVPSPGRTLKHEANYDKNRTAAQVANKSANHPENKGRNTLRRINSRVIEFAKIRNSRPKEFDNIDVLAGEGL